MAENEEGRSVEVTDANVFSSFDDYEPSVTGAVFVYWILPVLAIAFLTRFLVDPYAASGLGIGAIPDETQIPPKQTIHSKPQGQPPTTVPTTPSVAPTPQRPKRKETPLPTLVLEKPTSYIEAVQGITRRRLNWEETDSSTMGDYAKAKPDKPKSASAAARSKADPEKPVRGASSDPVRNQRLARIDDLRQSHEVSPRQIKNGNPFC